MTTAQQQVVGLTKISPLVLDLSGVDALTTANVAGLSPSAFSVLTSTGPATGVQTVSIGESGVTFDLGNTGATGASVGWITPGEGFLVNLPSGATTISNGSELFGTATVMPNGQTAGNGFAALSAFDVNASGTIDASDPIFNQLQVWVDTGSGADKASTPVGTLLSLGQLNIQSLNLNATKANEDSQGNTIGLISSYTTTDGQTHELADVWLASTAASSNSVDQLSNALSQYTTNPAARLVGSQTFTNGSDLAGTEINNSSPDTNTLLSTATLSNNTQLLANALSQYSQSNASTPLATNQSSLTTTPTSPVSNTLNGPSTGALSTNPLFDRNNKTSGT